MPHDKALRSAELFAREVMPHFRAPGEARPGRPAATPRASAAMSDFVDEPARRTPVLARTQVLVVGGGSRRRCGGDRGGARRAPTPCWSSATARSAGSPPAG